MTNVKESEHTPTYIKLYPNPSKGLFFIESEEDILEIKVSNMLGQQIEALHTNGTLDLSMHTSGVYFISIETKKGISSHKILKQ